jgi:hypothetical protein
MKAKQDAVDFFTELLNLTMGSVWTLFPPIGANFAIEYVTVCTVAVVEAQLDLTDHEREQLNNGWTVGWKGGQQEAFDISHINSRYVSQRVWQREALAKDKCSAFILPAIVNAAGVDNPRDIFREHAFALEHARRLQLCVAHACIWGAIALAVLSG